MAKDQKGNGKEQQIKGPAPAGNAMPMFYQNPTPLDGKAHAKLGLKPDFDFSFARNVNAVPVNIVEIPQVAQYYPVAFSNDATGTPVAVLGVRDNENLFVDENGNWLQGYYIPSYIRRYPFIFAETQDGEQLTLCIDMNDNVTSEDSEQKFFDDEGKPSELANNALEFCKSYHTAAQQTVPFSKTLLDKGLLTERKADLNVGNSKRITFSGFKAIDEKKLAELDDETFLDFRKKGYLPFIYAQMFSAMNWQSVTRLLSERMRNDKDAA